MSSSPSAGLGSHKTRHGAVGIVKWTCSVQRGWNRCFINAVVKQTEGDFKREQNCTVGALHLETQSLWVEMNVAKTHQTGLSEAGLLLSAAVSRGCTDWTSPSANRQGEMTNGALQQRKLGLTLVK